MDDLCIYQIVLQGQMDERELNVMSPFEMRVMRANTDSTLFAVRTDQSGLIGLMRHLHGHGFVLLSVRREQ